MHLLSTRTKPSRSLQCLNSNPVCFGSKRAKARTGVLRTLSSSLAGSPGSAPAAPSRPSPHGAGASEHGDQLKAPHFCRGDNTDEGFIKNGAFGQATDHLPALAAAGWRYVHLLGVPHDPVLQGVERLVTAHPHLQKDRHSIRTERLEVAAEGDLFICLPRFISWCQQHPLLRILKWKKTRPLACSEQCALLLVMTEEMLIPP